MKRKADIPGWTQVLGLIIAILVLVFLIWLAIRSGKAGVDVIGQIP